MTVHREPFGSTPNGEPVGCWVLRSDVGLEVRVLELGATVQGVRHPDGTEVILGFPELEGYLQDPTLYFGAIVGRCANRIGGGRYRLDGRDVVLPVNDRGNTLHGGPDGYDRRVWSAVASGKSAVRLSLVSTDGDQGHPGTLRITATYTAAGDSVRIDLEALTDAPTVVNLTNHSYFNLGGEGTGSVLDHSLEVRASAYRPIDPHGLPVGTVLPVDGTPFDFRAPRRLGAGLRESHPQLLAGRGYDHDLVLDQSDAGLRTVARLQDPHSGRSLQLDTTEPGLQVYSGNFLDGSRVGSAGRSYRQSDGIALEAQLPPDAVNRPGWPSPVLRPGERRTQTTLWRLR